MTDGGPFGNRRDALRAGAVAIVGGLAGCMQPLLEEGANTDDGETGSETGSESGTSDSDDDAGIELERAWQHDNLDRVFVDDGQFVGRTSPDIQIVSWGGDLEWTSQSSDPDGYSVWPNDGRGFARNEEHVFVHHLSWGMDESSPAHVYAFDAETGAEQWVHDTGMDRIGGMAATGDVLYYGARPFDRDTVEAPIRAYDLDQREYRWERRFGTHDTWGLTVAGSRVYVTQDQLYVLDRETGELESEYSIAGPTKRENDTIYVTGFETVTAIDIAENRLEWQLETERNYRTRVATSDDDRICYAGDSAGYLTAIDVETGDERWERRLDGTVTYTVVLDEGIVWAYDDTSVVWGFDADDGTQLFRRETDADGDDRIAAHDGRVYLPEPDYRAYDVVDE